MRDGAEMPSRSPPSAQFSVDLSSSRREAGRAGWAGSQGRSRRRSPQRWRAAGRRSVQEQALGGSRVSRATWRECDSERQAREPG